MNAKGDLICTHTNTIIDTVSLKVIFNVVFNIRLLNMLLLFYEGFRELQRKLRVRWFMIIEYLFSFLVVRP